MYYRIFLQHYYKDFISYSKYKIKANSEKTNSRFLIHKW